MLRELGLDDNPQGEMMTDQGSQIILVYALASNNFSRNTRRIPGVR
jgi:hypothetical protein